MAEAPTGGRHPLVLAVAESDAYLKWAACLLDEVGWEAGLAVLASDIAPTPRQRELAVAATKFAGGVEDVSLPSLRHRIRQLRPDVLLLACTGPTIAVITSMPTGHRPLVVAGLPGIGLPVRERAIRARRGVDVFVTHSRRERDEYGAAFERDHAARQSRHQTDVALATLPFLAEDGRRCGGERIVFAPQPSVPASREQRRRLLVRLAALGPPAPIVKLRNLADEPVTHRERAPYERLWEELVADGAVEAGAVEFRRGALAAGLDDARCLVTVSSTAALEAIGLGCPAVIIDDFGVDDELLNGVFAGSDITGPLDVTSIGAATLPSAGWLDRNYFHGRENDDWTSIVTSRLGARRARARVGWRTTLSRTVITKAVRLAAAGVQR